MRCFNKLLIKIFNLCKDLATLTITKATTTLRFSQVLSVDKQHITQISLCNTEINLYDDCLLLSIIVENGMHSNVFLLCEFLLHDSLHDKNIFTYLNNIKN